MLVLTFLCFILSVVWYLTGEVGGATPSPHLGGRGGGLTTDLTLPLWPALLLTNFCFLSTIFTALLTTFIVQQNIQEDRSLITFYILTVVTFRVSFQTLYFVVCIMQSVLFCINWNRINAPNCRYVNVSFPYKIHSHNVTTGHKYFPNISITFYCWLRFLPPACIQHMYDVIINIQQSRWWKLETWELFCPKIVTKLERTRAGADTAGRGPGTSVTGQCGDYHLFTFLIVLLLLGWVSPYNHRSESY